MHRPSFLRSKARLATATLTLVPGLVPGLASCSSEAAETGDPLFGGRAIVQVYGLSDSLNGAIDNSNTTLAIQYEIHETLLLKDWGTTQFVPNVAEAWHTEDLVVLKK